MTELPVVFATLVAILRPYASKLDIATDTPSELYVNTRHIEKNKKPLFFGAVLLKKQYVAFHLMPVYVEPALLNDISAELRKRMQGKSCFNFTHIDQTLFDELTKLTEAGYASYKKRGFV